MNNWYNRINPPSSQPRVQINNPMQQAQYIMQAMQNPVAFVQEQFPDVPENIRNNPNAILQYLSNTRGQPFIQQMQQVAGTRGR